MRRSVLGCVLVFACASPPPTSAPTRAPTPPPSAAPLAPVALAAPEEPCAGETFGATEESRAIAAARVADKKGTSGTATKQLVVSSHRRATEAGLAVLRSGGTAADAFVATVLVQDVVFPGVTSTAGLAGILVYDAKTKKVTYVHGGLADPIEPARRHRAGDTAKGKLVLVPGAPAAYAELVKRFGKKNLRELVEPAAKLAADGFPVDALYARSIAAHRAKLERSTYGKASFFRDGKPLAEGETLRLADLARTLRSYGKEPTWFYRGPWVTEAVALTNANGGSVTARDFETYAPEIAPAMRGTFMGHDLYAAGHGGLKVLASLGALELLRGGRAGLAPSADAGALELLVRVQRATNTLPELRVRDLAVRGADVARLAADVARVVESGTAPVVTPEAGTHSSAAIVVDREGNVVVGTHTIETLNWGEGLFVGGVPLATAALSGFDDATTATTRVRADPLTTTIALEGGAVRAALTVYGTGLHPADVQLLDAVLARGVDPESAVLEPRVGYFAFDAAANTLNTSITTVNPRFGRELLCTLSRRGFALTRSMPGMPPGYVDTGFPTLVTLAPGVLRGMPPDPFFVHGLAAGD